MSAPTPKHGLRWNPPPNPGRTLVELLNEFRARHWVLHIFGPQDGPDLYAATYAWEGATDVFLLRAENSATAFRVPTPNEEVDYFEPRRVLWQYHAPPDETMVQLFNLVPPGEPGCPMVIQHPNRLCVVPRSLRSRVGIRPLGQVQRSMNWEWFSAG